jgi:hypothetical protein
MRSRILIISLILVVFTGSAAARAIYDFDGDGRTDFIVQRSNGAGTSHTWFIQQSTDGFTAIDWGYQPPSGQGGDGPAMGDFDGDGKWDITVVRYAPPSPYAVWYVLNSSDGTMTAQQWGLVSDTRVPQDYDGDLKTDFAVYRSGWWYVLRSSDGQFQAVRVGKPYDEPLMGGDYDGDGKDDMVIVRSTQPNARNMFVHYSSGRRFSQYFLGGYFNTAAVTGDYDGDGKADVAIWQVNGVWSWIRSSDGAGGGGITFGSGVPGFDTPHPADYDGDGKTDPAVLRPYGYNPDNFNLYFLVQQSRDGFIAFPWGLRGLDMEMYDARSILASPARPSGGVGRLSKDDGPLPRLVATGTY